jgi:heme A synthase
MRSHSTKATVALVLSVIAVLVCPVLYFAEYVALIGVATVSSEESNPVSFTVAMIAIMIGLALLSFALPITALLIASRARRDVRSSPESLSGRPISLAASIISVGVIVVLVLGQTFIALSAAGVCSLDGCS